MVLRLDKMMIVHTSNILYEYCQPGGKSEGRKTDLNTMAGDFLVRPVLEVFKLVINCADFLGIKVSYLT